MNHALALNRFVRLFSVVKVPLLALARPTIIELTDKRAVVKLPLNWLTKNHVSSMYFGALAMGAELSIAAQVLHRIRHDKIKLNFIFKSYRADFLKRADADVYFCCDQVAEINVLIEKALGQDERIDGTFSGIAVSKKDESVKFMSYEINISLKKSNRSAL